MSKISRPIQFRYIFDFGSSNREVFNLEIDEATGRRIDGITDNFPEWSKLGFAQCPNCPLDVTETEYCPAATALTETAHRLGKVVSHAEVQLVVISEDRWVGKKTTSQSAISSLIGFQIATSGCPNVDFLRPMARFHLPLANLDETLTRVVGMYFLGQYYRFQDGGHFDMKLEGLAKNYSELQTVNSYIADRLRSSGEIVELNAFAVLDQLAQIIPLEIEDALEDVRELFTEHQK